MASSVFSPHLIYAAGIYITMAEAAFGLCVAHVSLAFLSQRGVMLIFPHPHGG